MEKYWNVMFCGDYDWNNDAKKYVIGSHEE